MRSESNDPTLKGLLEQAGWMRRLAARLVRDPNQADDLVQDAYLTMMTSPPRSGRAGRPWISRVLLNLARKEYRGHTRRRRRESASAVPEAQPATDQVVARLDQRRQLAELVLDLPEPYRTTIILRYIEGLKSREVARIHDVPEPTARWRAQEGLARLRRKLDERHGGDRATWIAALLPMVQEPALAAAGGGLSSFLVWRVLMMKPLLSLAITAAVCCVAWMLIARGSKETETPTLQFGEARESTVSAAATPEEQTTAVRTEAGLLEPSAAADSGRVPEPTVVATVKARFVDEDGKPLAGVTLSRVADSTGYWEDDSSEETDSISSAGAESGSDGWVTLIVSRTESGLQGGAERCWSAEFGTSAPLRSSRGLKAVVSADRVTHLGTICLRGAGTVTGQVRDAEGRPLEGLVVSAEPNTEEYWSPANAVRHRGDRARPVATQTDEEGRYRLSSVPAHLAIVSVWGVVRTVSLEPGEVAEIDFEVRLPDHSGKIRCEVVGPDGRPVPDGCVTYRRPSKYGGMSVRRARIDRDGLFYLDENETGLLEMEIWVADEGGKFRRRIFPLETPVDQLRRIELREAEQIEIQVRTLEGEVITDFSAQLVMGRPGILDTAYDHHSDAGIWRVRRPVQPFEVQVDAIGYASTQLGFFQPADVREPIVVTMRPHPGLRGQVMFEGNPVAGARVHFAEPVKDGQQVTCLDFVSSVGPRDFYRAVITDQKGRFQAPLGRGGELIVHAEAGGFAPGEAGPFEFDPSIGAENILVELGRGGQLVGRVLVPADIDPSGMIIGISCGDGFPRSQRIGPDGRYQFADLRPGLWELAPCQKEVGPRAVADCSTSYGVDSPDPVAEWDFEVLPGRTTVHDLDLRGAEPCILRGRIRVGNLTSPQTWTVSLCHQEETQGRVYGGTDADGSFLVRKPTPGPHRLWLEGRFGALINTNVSCQLELSPGENRWDLSIETGTLDGVLHREWRSKPLYHVLEADQGVWIRTHVYPDDTGHVSRTVPAGHGRIVQGGSVGNNDIATWPTICEVIVPAGGTALFEIR